MDTGGERTIVGPCTHVLRGGDRDLGLETVFLCKRCRVHDAWVRPGEDLPGDDVGRTIPALPYIRLAQ